METIEYYYRRIFESGGSCNIQLSGGEPSLRDDLPDIISLGHKIGFRFIQLNTNGIRLAEDLDFVKSLKEAGLSSVFLQFDGLDDSVYLKLRGKKLLDIKLKAIENLKKVEIGTILVPTVVPGVNDDQLYSIVRFGADNIPVIRGVHFQPVSHFGRIPKIPQDQDRITLPEVMERLADQSGGVMKLTDFKPPGCENSYCSFNANYVDLDGRLVQLGTNNKKSSKKIEDGKTGAINAKAFVERNWALKQYKLNEDKYSSFTDILKKIDTNRFAISAMGFQDAWNVDTERLRGCCIHVVSEKGNLIPFCAYNLTNQDGQGLYRNME